MAKIVNKQNYKFMSKKLMLERTNSVSKKTLNLKLAVDPNTEDKIAIAAFVYHNFKDLMLDEVKHDELMNLYNIYSRDINKKNSECYKYNEKLTELLSKHGQDVETKLDIIDQFDKLRKTRKISLSKLFEQAEVRYANAYNFFVKKQTTKITLEKAEEILSLAING